MRFHEMFKRLTDGGWTATRVTGDSQADNPIVRFMYWCKQVGVPHSWSRGDIAKNFVGRPLAFWIGPMVLSLRIFLWRSSTPRVLCNFLHPPQELHSPVPRKPPTSNQSLNYVYISPFMYTRIISYCWVKRFLVSFILLRPHLHNREPSYLW